MHGTVNGVEQTVLSLLGQQLDAVTVYQHWFDDAPSGEVTRFWLHFRARPTYYAHGDGSGQTLHLSLGEPGPTVDMDQYGQMRVHSAREGHPLAGIIGHRLEDAKPICSRVQGCKTGLLLRFDHGAIVVMMYCDDMLIITGDVLPTIPEPVG